MSRPFSILLGIVCVGVGWHFEHLIAIRELPKTNLNLLQVYGLMVLGVFLIFINDAASKLKDYFQKGEGLAKKEGSSFLSVVREMRNKTPTVLEPFPGTILPSDAYVARHQAAMKNDIDTLKTLAKSYPEKERELKAVADHILQRMFEEPDATVADPVPVLPEGGAA